MSESDNIEIDLISGTTETGVEPESLESADARPVSEGGAPTVDEDAVAKPAAPKPTVPATSNTPSNVAEPAEPTPQAPAKAKIPDPLKGSMPRTRLGRFLESMFRPSRFWAHATALEPPSVVALMWPYVFVLAALRSTAAIIGSLSAGATVGAALITGVTTLIAAFGLVMVIAIAMHIIAAGAGSEAQFRRSFQLAAVGLTPLLLMGIVAIAPVPHVGAIAEVLALPYTFYVMSVGVGPMLALDADDAPGIVGLVNGITLTAWSLLAGAVALLGS